MYENQNNTLNLSCLTIVGLLLGLIGIGLICAVVSIAVLPDSTINADSNNANPPNITNAILSAQNTPVGATNELAFEAQSARTPVLYDNIDSHGGLSTSTPSQLPLPSTPLDSPHINFDYGGGEIRLYGPAQIKIGEVAQIRVEIELDSPSVNTSYEFPAPTATPELRHSRPTSTPLPLIDVQFVEVYGFMGADLRGRNISSFDISRVPARSLRPVEPNGITWWYWNIIPSGDESLGLNELEMAIYIEVERSDGEKFEIETNIIPFTIEVVDSSRSLLSRAGTYLDTAMGRIYAVIIGILNLAIATRMFNRNNDGRNDFEDVQLSDHFRQHNPFNH